MALNFPQSIRLNDYIPLDTRLTVDHATDRFDIQYPYPGLIVFARDTKELYLAYDKSAPDAPQNEMAWCKLDTELSDLYIKGYYYENKFYYRLPYIEDNEIKDLKENKIYVDLNNFDFYAYLGAGAGFKPFSKGQTIPDADSQTKGIMKLYSTSGQGEDGTMTQKSITDGVNSISLKAEKVDTDDDGSLEDEDYILMLDLPWD